MKKFKYYFPLLIGLLLLLAFISELLLDTDILVFQSLSESFNEKEVEIILNNNQKLQWVGYVLLPIVLLLKIVVISAVLYMGTFFFEKKITYKRLFTIVTKAEFVFLLVGLVKLVWFVFQDDYTLQDVQSFYPLSALSLVGYKELQPWFVYPFQTLNLFELAYWIILAWLLGKEIQSTTDKALKIVASSYGSALLIWVVAVMFLTLNMS